jgi:hypothetical protein
MQVQKKVSDKTTPENTKSSEEANRIQKLQKLICELKNGVVPEIYHRSTLKTEVQEETFTYKPEIVRLSE